MHLIGVDSEYLFSESQSTFWGSKIFYYKGNDITQLFGVLKHLFVIEHIFSEYIVCLIIGKEEFEQYKISEWLIEILDKIGVKTVVSKSNNSITLLQKMSSSLSHIITRRKQLLQMVNGLTFVFLPNKDKKLVKYSEEKMLKEMGIRPQMISTHMALTEGENESKFTIRQAQRLISQYGDMEKILANLPNINDKKIVSKLLSNKKKLLKTFVDNKILCEPNNEFEDVVNDLINQPRSINTSFLEEVGFYSLIRPVIISDMSTIIQSEKDNNDDKLYTSILPNDNVKLEELSKNIKESGLCSIDTESSDKNPQLAELYGVSFSINPGEAFYIPFVSKNARQMDISKFKKWFDDVFIDKNVKFIGHNIKYDYLLLKRHGFTIKNIYFDTMLAAYELFGDLFSFSLSSLAEKYLNLKTTQYKDLVNKDKTLINIPFSKLVNYACEDADTTMKLYLWLKKKLDENQINDQFFNHTMPKVVQFGDIEYIGIKTNKQKLASIRNQVVEKMERLSKELYNLCSESFDIDSTTEVRRVLLNHLKLKNYDKKIKESFLIQLAKHYVAPRLILEYKKEKSILKKLDQIFISINENKVYPIFNLLKNPIGLVETEKPDLLTLLEDVDMLGVYLPNDFIFYRNINAVLKRISEITGYKDFEIELEEKQKVFIAIIDDCKDINIFRLFVHVLIGYSEYQIAKEFYVVQRKISEVKHKMRECFFYIFKWFEDFKNKAIIKGYAELNNRKKFLYGLNSSNMSKKEIALQNIVRWAIRY